jgi:hypothetical protein
MKSAFATMALLALALSVGPALRADSTTAQPLVTDAASQPREVTVTGKVEKRDVSGESTYVLVGGDQTYILMPQGIAADLADKTVTVTGFVEDNTLTIAEISEP